MPSLYERLMAEVCDKEKEVVEAWLRDREHHDLIYFQEVIKETIQELSEQEAEELANYTNFTFGFYVNDQLVDHLFLNENNEVVAIAAFLNEKGWNSKLTPKQQETAYVGLIEEGGD